jgi:hypothetical protein
MAILNVTFKERHGTLERYFQRTSWRSWTLLSKNVMAILNVTFKERRLDAWEQHRPKSSHYTDYAEPVPQRLSIIYTTSKSFKNSEMDKHF